MADQGILAQSKPAAATDTVLYRAPVDQSASTVLNIANDGTGSAYSVAVKNYDQRLTLDASTYLLHPGDIISNYTLNVDVNMTSSSGFSAGQLITTDDGEKSFRFESFSVPVITNIFVKTVDLTPVTVETITGTFAVGDTISTGAAPDDTTAVIYGINDSSTTATLYIGPQTINGAGSAFAAGNSVATASASATISAGGIGTATEEFVFSNTTIGGVYNSFLFEQVQVFIDRTYRFDISDSSMATRDFKLSLTVNGEWGEDGVIGGVSPDDGTEYTFGKTVNGTAGNAGAYIQYDFGAGSTTNDPLTGSPYLGGFAIYYYDGQTGTATNADLGGSDRLLYINSSTEYDELHIYDVDGSIVASSDTFEVQGVTYTVTSVNAGPYGFVRRYSGTTLDVIKGPGSQDFAGTDTFYENPKDNTAARSQVTVSSVDVASNAVTAENYIVVGATNSANNVDKITSLVVGPGEVVVVNSTTQNNVFSLVGFEDSATSFATRVFNYS